MTLSYKDSAVRNYCRSLSPDSREVLFTAEKIVMIRAHLSDLKSAPSLADAPVDFKIDYDEDEKQVVVINFEDVKIISLVVNKFPRPKPSEIKRLLVLDIV